MLSKKFHPATFSSTGREEPWGRDALAKRCFGQEILARINLSPTWISYPREGGVG